MKKENLLLLGIADHEPSNCNDFFRPLVDEFKKLGSEGMRIGENTIRVYLILVTADLPAKKKVDF